jgi:hypoxanthine phosphoribosyltransferase
VHIKQTKILKKKLFIPKEEIQRRIKQLAQQITTDYDGREPIFVGILNGVVFFFSDLVRQIDVPSKFDFVRASSYGSRMCSSGTIRMTKDIEVSIEGEAVVLIEDIVDTGLTLNHIIESLQKRNPESLRVCALIDKLERRRVPVSLDYCGFQVEEGFIVGYGLDYDEKYRYLPDIYLLE